MKASLSGSSGPQSVPRATAVSLRDRFQPRAGLLRVVGTHSYLSAQLAEAAGFDGVWASSLEISTVLGVCDDGVDSGALVVKVARRIAAHTSIPVIVDCQVRHDDLADVRRCMATLRDSGVAGVCLQDSRYPCPNSLLSATHALAPRNQFCQTLRTVRESVRSEVLVLARVQAFIAGTGPADALERARAYCDTGVDGVVVHSRSPRPDEVMNFLEQWDRPTPLVLIPTTYHAITVAEIAASGKVGMVIYSNHGLRAAIAAMERVFGQIRSEGTAHHTEEWIAPLARVFELQKQALAAREGPGT